MNAISPSAKKTSTARRRVKSRQKNLLQKKKIRRKKKFSGKEGKNHRRRLKLYRVGLMPKPENPKRALACPHSRLVRERG